MYRQRQKQVLEAFNRDFDLVLTNKEIIELSGIRYYHQTKKWIGVVLSRMVKNGSLVRVSIGHYRLSTQPKNPPVITDPNQVDLFK